MEELKPCPFCGGTSMRVSWRASRNSKHIKRYKNEIDYEFKKYRYYYQVICNNCKSRGMPILSGFDRECNLKKYEILAVEAWNRRADNEKTHKADN